MIRFVFRFLGLWILAAAFLLFVYDGTKSIAGNMLYKTDVESLWNSLITITPQELGKAKIEQFVGDWLWDPVILTVLHAPAFVLFFAIGCLFILIGRKKKPLIGYARD